ncbi:MAG: hypothetical protein KAH21_05830, partial [Spirochaetaceae bacterium]|nr:hypothetical protein [Spirochaetaceae bacterium]
MIFKKNRNHILQFSVLLLSIFLSFIVIKPLREVADKRAEVRKNSLIGQIEESLGLNISYDSISPALLSIVTVRGLSVSFDQGDFTAERVRVFYNPLRRLKGYGKDPINLISRIAVSDSYLNLLIDSNTEKKESTQNTKFDPWLLLADKSVDITNFFVSIRTDQSLVLSADDVSLLMKDDNGTFRYAFNGTLHAEGPGSVEKFGKIESVVSSRGIYSPESSTANGRLDLISASSDLLVLEPLAIDFTLVDNGLTARRINDSRPFDFSFMFSDEGLDLKWEAESLSLREIAAPGTGSGSWDPWFSSVIDGAFSFSSSLDLKEMSYNTDISVSLLSGS